LESISMPTVMPVVTRAEIPITNVHDGGRDHRLRDRGAARSHQHGGLLRRIRLLGVGASGIHAQAIQDAVDAFAVVRTLIGDEV